jgi:hypothetical protein
MNFGSLNVSYIKKYPAGIGAAVLALVMIVALAVRHMEFSEQQAVYDNTAAEGQKLAANIAHAGQLEEQLKALEEANKTISGRLVNPSDLAINLQYFYKLEADTGVKLLDMHPVYIRPYNMWSHCKAGTCEHWLFCGGWSMAPTFVESSVVRVPRFRPHKTKAAVKRRCR